EKTKIVTYEQCRLQMKLIRCIVGTLPFRPVDTTPSWWRDYTAVKIAQVIYEERAWGEMPLLADSVEEAGCDNLDVLLHCRGPGPHARGCWVVDTLLKKN